MRKNLLSSLRLFNSGVKRLIILTQLLCVSFFSNAQTLISPTADGGFESGTTFAANNWTVANQASGNRVWYCGIGQAGYTGARCAFIGNNATTVGTNAAARLVHLYRSVTFPAGATNIQLSFKYKQATADFDGTSVYDYLEVYTGNTAPTSGNVSTGTLRFGLYPTIGITAFTTQNVTLPNSLAGTTTNLIFSFTADNVSPNAYGAIDDVSLTYTAAVACSGTPSASSTISSANPVCSGTNFTLSLGTSYTATGISYQWQSADNAAFTVGLANLGTAATQVTSQTTDKYYRCRVTCSNGGSFIYSTGLLVTTNVCYCNSTGSTFADGITGVIFNTINNTGTSVNTAYTDYTGTQNTSVTKGNSYTLNVFVNTGGNYTNYQYAWIDWNHNGLFTDAGEFYNLGSVTNSVNGLNSSSILVPSLPYTGITRMRIQSKYNSVPSGSCETGFDGEVEDYSITVADPVANDAGISGLVTTSFCAGTQPVQAVIKNYGTSNLTSATITWTVNAVAQTPYNWTGNLANGATANISIGTYNFAAATNYTIVVKTNVPNGVTDGNTGNDTYTTPVFQTSLSGNYTVGTSGNFTTLTAAVAAANAYGICGPTRFLLTNTGYNSGETFPIVINQLAGSSAANTLTIKPAPGVSASISGNALSIINLNGADYVIIDGSNTDGGTTRNLTISNTSTSTSSDVIWINSVDAGNAALNNSIKNCIITGNPGYTNDGIITSASVVGSAAEAANNNTLIENNQISAVYTGIALVGKTGTNDQGNIVRNNFLGSSVNANKIAFIGMQIINQQNCLMKANSIIGLRTDFDIYAGAGINLFGTQKDNIIEDNIMRDLKNINSFAYGVVGILLEADNTDANLIVRNNFVSDVAGYGYSGNNYEVTDNGYGIAVDLGGGYKIYNNTVLLNTNPLDASVTNHRAAAFLVTNNVTAPNAIDLRNNILVNTQTLGNSNSRYAIATGNSVNNNVFASIDFNDYYSTSGRLGIRGNNGSQSSDIAGIQGSFGGNGGSVNILPVFVSASDLHLDQSANNAINDLGTPLAEVQYDIDADPRNTLTPDMGADEFSPCTSSLFTWIGKTSSDWNLGSNWCNGTTPPTAGVDVVIPAGLTNYPVVSSTNAVASAISIAANASLVINNNGILSMGGNMTSNGSFNNNGKIILNGSSAQTFPGGTGTLSSMNVLEVNNTAGVILNRDIRIDSALIPTDGNINLGNSIITITSTAMRTASVAPLGSGAGFTYGTGRFEIERYLPSYRAWRFVAAPVVKGAGQSPSVREAWQEGGATTAGYGTYITGPSLAGTGFDTLSTGYSLKWFDASINNYREIRNTNDSLVANDAGYMVYVRGDRTISPTGPTRPTNLRIRGKIRTGDQTFTLPGGPSGVFQSIGNPYASAFSVADLINNYTPSQLAKSYTAWDPTLNGSYGAGGFQTLSEVDGYQASAAGSGLYLVDSLYPNIESGQAFYLFNPSTTPVNVVITESMKQDGSRLASRENTPADRQFLRTRLYTNTGAIADGNLVAIDDEYDNGADAWDALKFTNGGENFGLSRYGKKLSVEARGRLHANDTIFYNMSNLREQAYQLQLAPENLASTGLEGYFTDRFLNTQTPVSLAGPTTLSFTVTSNAASKAANRFLLVFKAMAGPLPVTFVSVSAQRQSDRSILVNWKVANELNIIKYEVERSADGTQFSSILSRDAAGMNAYSKTDLSPLAADNFYRIKAIGIGGEISYSSVVKVSPINTAPSISIYPNPVTGKQMNLYFTDQPKGLYNIYVNAVNGQLVYEAKIAVNDNNFVQNLVLPENILPGVYQVSISSAKNSASIQNVIIK